MNALDIGIVVWTALGFILGWRFRAISLVSLLLALSAGVLAGNRFQAQAQAWYDHLPPALAACLGWLTPFTAVALAVLLVGALLSGMIRTLRLKWLDQLAGALLGTVFALFLLLAGLSLFAPLEKIAHLRWVENSRLAGSLLAVSRPWLEQSLEILPRLQPTVRP